METKQVTYQDLLDFLHHEGALEAWKKNLPTEEGFEKAILEFRPDTWIGIAFVWAGTPEGDKYWYQLEKKWKRVLCSPVFDTASPVEPTPSTKVYVVLKRITDREGGAATVVGYSTSHDTAVTEMVKQSTKTLEALSILELETFKPSPDQLILAAPGKFDIQVEFRVVEVPEIKEE